MITTAFLVVLGLYCVAAASVRYDYYLPKNNNTQLSGSGGSCSKIYSQCGDTKDDAKRVKPVAFDISPCPPKKGQKISISVDIMLLEKVTSGEVKVTLKYGNIPIVDETLDLCDLVTQIQERCPLDENKDIKFSTDHEIPDYVPSGEYTGDVKLTDQNGKELICLNLDLKI